MLHKWVWFICKQKYLHDYPIESVSSENICDVGQSLHWSGLMHCCADVFADWQDCIISDNCKYCDHIVLRRWYLRCVQIDKCALFQIIVILWPFSIVFRLRRAPTVRSCPARRPTEARLTPVRRWAGTIGSVAPPSTWIIGAVCGTSRNFTVSKGYLYLLLVEST